MDKLKQFFIDNKDMLIKPIVVMTCIGIIVTLALSLTDSVTRGRIAELAEEKQNDAMKQVIKADEYKSAEDESGEYHIAVTDGKTVGYVFSVTAKGYGGDVVVMTGVYSDGTVSAVDILDASNETPGLGQNVTKESFYKQFKGKIKDINVMKNGAVSENNEINAVTGATISSRAVTGAVNEALERYEKVSASVSEETQKGGETVEE